MNNKISRLSLVSSKNKGNGNHPRQGELGLGIDKERDIDGIGMGVLSDGTPYLNQRGLAALCGVKNAHIGTISSQWNDDDLKPKIKNIKSILRESDIIVDNPHLEIEHRGVVHYCYPASVCLAILEYYAMDAGPNKKSEARRNYRLLSGSKLQEMIYSQVGYGDDNSIALRKWHERIELNHQSAPSGYFSIFNEAHTVIYELIMAGAEIGETMVPDISIGIHWAKHWDRNRLNERFGDRRKFPHRYPDDHPQARSNPQVANCYPLDALGEYRRWLQNEYLDGGKFKNYLSRKSLPPSISELAISRLSPGLLE
ncbi:hypothetical protein [Acetobacter aceti]|uniref:hypothetical protein n=1 Tax=Acetobacter aceti TaxID=435 RepID=UPI0011AFC00F|nr:hypothetical protein [Acetobacter aceti]